MNSRIISNNPFAKAKTRTIVYWFILVIPLLFLLYLTIGLLIDIPALIEGRQIDFEDPIFNSILINFYFYLVIIFWLRIYQTRTRFSFKYLLGNIYLFKNASLLLMAIPLILLSIGTSQFFNYLLFLINPETAMGAIEQELFLTSEATAYPLLYNTIQVIAIVILAPIIEEILFRGIFLHRWATKWSIRTAVITSSIAFGCLHFDFISASIFGLIVSLIYLKTKSLALAIAIHFLNNLIFMALSFFSLLKTTSSPTPTPTPTLETLESSLLPAAIAIIIASIWLIIFCRQNWRFIHKPLPYFVNRDHHKAHIFPD